MNNVKATDVLALVDLFKTSAWNELHVEIDGLQLFLSRDPQARLGYGAAMPQAAPPTPVASPLAMPAAQAAAAPAVASPAVAADAGQVPANWQAIRAPNLGTFYRSPKPGAAPYVTEGAAIAVGSELCQLEVMKLFTLVKSAVSGTVRRVCVEDGTMVESGAVLFYIEPA